MVLKVFGSSSAGNGYVLRASDGEAIVLECSCPLLAIKRFVNYQVNSIKGVFVTHEHGDHAGKVHEYLNDLSAPVYMSGGTIEALQERKWKARRMPNIVKHGDIVECGRYRVMALVLRIGDAYTHDAREPMCYLISHEECGNVLFITDSCCVPYNINGLNNIMIECNYDAELLEARYEAGKVDYNRLKRTVKSHMSIENCKKELLKMDLKDCMNIILLHISKDNGHLTRFEREVGECVRKSVKVALNGLKINLSKDPF